MKKKSNAVKEQARILRTLQTNLRMLGDANDAEDHGFEDFAAQERKEACAVIRELMEQHPFIIDLLPTLTEELDTGHILTFGWAELFNRINLLLPEPEKKHRIPTPGNHG